MRKSLFIVATAVASVLFNSCTHCIYPVEAMYTNYALQMRSNEDLEVKSKVQIYFKEADIKGEYTIISCNTYNPAAFPIKQCKEKKMIKKFLAGATRKAYELGGNAILVKSAGFFFVLNLKDWNEENAPKVDFVNPIFDMKYADLVKSGEMNKMKRGERIRTEKAFMDEIEANIGNVNELDEVKAIRKKVDVLSSYNLKLKNPKNSIEKAVKKDTKKLNRAEKKIKKRIEKEKAAKASTKSKSKK